MIAIAIALAAALLHLATASRYGYFRDELYFIACGRHLAWGYVDQPPLVAFAAWIAQPAHDGLIALRLLPVLAAALTVYVAVTIARELGGGRFAQWLTGITVALDPAYLLLGNVLTTTSFEPLSWTLVLWCAMRRRWIALAFAASFGLYGKYSMALLLVAVLVGLLATREGKSLATPRAMIAALLIALLVLPNLWWQGAHGWPFVEVLRGDWLHRHAFNNGWLLESQNLWGNTEAFVIEQLVYSNPFAAPVWISGLVAPFVWPRLHKLRFVAVAYAVVLGAAILLEAKGYYVIGMYAVLLAVGSTVIERAATALRAALFGTVTAVALAALPLALPVLPIQALLRYTHSPHLVQPIFAEEFGWDRLARDVAVVYDALPARTRAETPIYADTYADAGAIDLFGPRYGLPNAISSQNTYWLWGTHGYGGQQIVAIGASRIAVLERYYRVCRLVRVSDEPLKWIVEGPAPIYLCTQPAMPLDAIWPHLRWYGA